MRPRGGNPPSRQRSKIPSAGATTGFFNKIDDNRTLETAAVQVLVGGKVVAGA
jgi:hypothetical protein